MSDEIKFGFTTDIHHNTCAPYSFFLWAQPGGASNSGEWRVCTTALVRLQRALDDFYAGGIDFMVDAGDLIDFSTPLAGETCNDMLDDVITVFDASDFVTLGSGEIAAITGNHEGSSSCWRGLTTPTMSEWVAKWDASCHITRANTYSIADAGGNASLTAPLFYTYDYGGFRFVMIGLAYYQDLTTLTDHYAAYLDTQAKATALPVIVCLHALGTVYHSQAFQDVLTDNTNIVLVLGGHDHRGMRHNLPQNAAWPDTDSSFNTETTYCRDVFAFTGGGGARPIENAGKDDPQPADTTWGVNDACHYIISVKPNVSYGVNRMRANVAVEGFCRAAEHTKAYDRFLAV